MTFTYPPARRGDVVDLHHGREIADPYRWLEDLDSNETADFVAAQNAVSGPYLAGLPDRAGLIERMTELWDIPRTEPPQVRGEGADRVMVWSHNDGLADQPTYWVQHGAAEPVVLARVRYPASRNTPAMSRVTVLLPRMPLTCTRTL